MPRLIVQSAPGSFGGVRLAVPDPAPERGALSRRAINFRRPRQRRRWQGVGRASLAAAAARWNAASRPACSGVPGTARRRRGIRSSAVARSSAASAALSGAADGIAEGGRGSGRQGFAPPRRLGAAAGRPGPAPPPGQPVSGLASKRPSPGIAGLIARMYITGVLPLWDDPEEGTMLASPLTHCPAISLLTLPIALAVAAK